MTLREYLQRAAGYHRRQEQDWRRTRWLGTLLLNVHRGEDDAPLSPEEVMPLPGDTPIEVLNTAELDAELARVAALDTDWL